MRIKEFWASVLGQDADAIRAYFHPNATVKWHNTNECFTVEEFIRANCEYPGEWDGKVERLIVMREQIITVTHVYSRDRLLSFHATSFIRIKDGKIAEMDEYWGDDGEPPQWRKDKHIGAKIVEEKEI